MVDRLPHSGRSSPTRRDTWRALESPRQVLSRRRGSREEGDRPLESSPAVSDGFQREQGTAPGLIVIDDGVWVQSGPAVQFGNPPAQVDAIRVELRGLRR